jgi:hypothetical protein
MSSYFISFLWRRNFFPNLEEAQIGDVMSTFKPRRDDITKELRKLPNAEFEDMYPLKDSCDCRPVKHDILGNFDVKVT